jgi:predicted ATPase
MPSTPLAHNAEPANPLAVRVALLTLLAQLAESDPVLVCIDDAQWVDESSMEALAFAARRLSAERIAVVATVRGEELIALRVDADAQLMVTGLSDTDSRTLLEDRAGISGPAADRLLQVAAGNPLALERSRAGRHRPVAEGVERCRSGRGSARRSATG